MHLNRERRKNVIEQMNSNPLDLVKLLKQFYLLKVLAKKTEERNKCFNKVAKGSQFVENMKLYSKQLL